ncbi:glycoside hydrolase family 15 protein, partial [Streptomyces massasporeus]
GHGGDAVPGGAGAFVPGWLWTAAGLSAGGHTEHAREVFERVLAVRNDVGLLAEQWDPQTGRQLGNAPQAFSHLALAETAFALSAAPPRRGLPRHPSGHA